MALFVAQMAFILLMLSGLFSTQNMVVEPMDPEKKYELNDVAFITGTWQNQGEGHYIEEVWSAPTGDNMMGMFRFVQEGKGVFYEMMIIEATDDGVVLRLKHFNAGLIGWEEKAEVHSFFLKKVADREAVFEQKDGKKRLHYVQASPSEMVVHLEEEKEGEWSKQSFEFKRNDA